MLNGLCRSDHALEAVMPIERFGSLILTLGMVMLFCLTARALYAFRGRAIQPLKRSKSCLILLKNWHSKKFLL